MSRLRSDRIVNKAGTGAPELSYGVTVPTGGVVVTGVVTATSFSGDGSGLSGIDAGALKDGSNVKVQAVPTGADVTGNLGVSGNLTVNGTTTTIDTIITEVDSLSVDGNISAGSSVTATSFYGNGSGLTGVESWNQLDTWLFSP
tara:strand:- start:2145 stop:2576 length:432 start_codon:yes stop_codon:yes gene_type:complete